MSPGPPERVLRPIGFLAIAAALASSAAAPAPLAGQRLGRFEQTSTNIGSFFYYVVPGTPTMQVQVMGAVRFPGLYELNDGTGLGQLLALAGGPVIEQRLGSDRLEVIVQLHRNVNGELELEYEGRDYNVSTSGVALREGDVLSVEVIRHPGIVWQDVVVALNAAALVALAIERFR